MSEISITLSPPDGVQIGSPVPDKPIPRAKCWRVPFSVSADASPGARQVAIETPRYFYPPERVVIYDHAPKISDLTVVMARKQPASFLFRLTAEDEKGDLEPSRLLGVLRCGKVDETWNFDGIVTERQDTKFSIEFGGMVKRAPAGPCSLNVRLTDNAGASSDWLDVTFEFQ